MKRETPPPVRTFEPPRLVRLGKVVDLTRAFNPGSNTDFTFSSF